MDSAADHEFIRKQAAPALIRAIDDLAERAGRDPVQMDGMRLGDAYRLAVSSYGDELPDFWRVWQQWNDMPEDPAPMGDL